MSEPHAATISVLVTNQPGVLVRVAGLTPPPDRIESFPKQLRKLVEVLRATAIDSAPTVDRELALIKVNSTAGTRMEIMEIANVFRANVVDLTDRTMTLEVTGRADKVDAIVSLLTKYGIREMARTGQVTLVRGAQNT